MKLVNGNILLKNPRLPDAGRVEVQALADSGAVHLGRYGPGRHPEDAYHHDSEIGL
jgi:hypothetical protein